MYHFVASFFFF